MRGAGLLTSLMAIALIAPSAAGAPSPRSQFLRAQAESREAAARSRRLEQRAQGAKSRADRARAARAAAVARIAVAEAGISAAEARIRMVEALRSAQRRRLAAEEQPLVPLVAALQVMARRPPALGLLQRGSIDDLVHTRALLASTMPQIAARTRVLRSEIAAAQRIEQESARAIASLDASRRALESERTRLAALEAADRRRSQTYVDAALDAGDRALALGEDARTIVSSGQQRRADAAVAAALARLDGPLLRPGTRAAPKRGRARPAYLLPVEGRLVIGAGEISEAGVHARGLTIEVAAGAVVVAPAGGRVLYAAPFRSFGSIVIIDHGAGWTTTVTDLGALEVAAGAPVARGQAIGRAPARTSPITVELRARGRPVPITPLLGSS